ncbi:MAG: DEAD/DEAH box helicase [Candidatus Diapherotrites archaeon]|uniref:ATP-dependent DNA helicase Hel308 n=1 Tax=Candidatus Iainarchaeum sp. TaxID=3101447 RepID=A0A938YTZ4_9ARCH|nr:DEAD/DEAH box helicase [Candidatus Diapherotrites archaeon]
MDIEKAVLGLSGIKGFNPMQRSVLKRDWASKSLVISAPTASGKTLMAELASLGCIINRKRKVVYTCPLRALAAEHWSEFRKRYSKELGIRVALSTGDLDSSSKYLQNYDLVFTTYEKLDSLLRHRSDFLSSVGLLVIDEVHILDSDRGPTLEIAATKLRQLNPSMQVLALSATIPNARAISKWLGAELVESSFRPIPLKEGVFFDGAIEYSDKSREELGEASLLALVKDTLVEKGKQAMVFANTRKRAEGIAKQLAGFVEKNLTDAERNALKRDSESALNALELETEQCKRLSGLISRGVAFHHAGLLSKQREIVEAAFKSNRLKLIAATPTLAAGVNLPSHTVIIPSLFRYTELGMQRIPVSEYKQQIGRAGRPKYDSEGRGIVFARTEEEAAELMELYVNGEIEPVESRLGLQPVLRMHLLGLIASNFVFDLASMESFFKKTFYALQYGNLQQLFGNLQEILLELKEMGFIEADEKRFSATALGRRVSELYLDPLSAFDLINAMNSGKEFNAFSWLFLLSNCSEMMPWLSVPKQREPELWEQLQLRKHEVPVDVEREMFFDLNLLRKFNTALLFSEWIEESREQEIMQLFNVQPGILHSKLQRCDWLSYSALELARLLGLEKHYSHLSRLRKRLKHGVKGELVFLTEVRHIGRVRARRLWKANVRSIADLRKIDLADLSRVLGSAVAEKIKAEIGQAKKI